MTSQIAGLRRPPAMLLTLGGAGAVAGLSPERSHLACLPQVLLRAAPECVVASEDQQGNTYYADFAEAIIKGPRRGCPSAGTVVTV